MVNNWVFKESGVSLVEHELNHPNRETDSETTLGWLLHASRNEIVLKMHRFSSKEVWDKMVSKRTKAYSTRSMRPWLQNDGVEHKNRNYWDSASESEEPTQVE